MTGIFSYYYYCSTAHGAFPTLSFGTQLPNGVWILFSFNLAETITANKKKLFNILTGPVFARQIWLQRAIDFQCSVILGPGQAFCWEKSVIISLQNTGQLERYRGGLERHRRLRRRSCGVVCCPGLLAFIVIGVLRESNLSVHKFENRKHT